MSKFIVTCPTCKGTDFKVIEEVQMLECTNCEDEIDLFGLDFYISQVKEEKAGM